MTETQPRVFVKTIDGAESIQYAYSPADAVALQFNGWRERKSAPAAAPEPAAATAKTSATAKDKPVKATATETSDKQ